jgi:hypothetical protein
MNMNPTQRPTRPATNFAGARGFSRALVILAAAGLLTGCESLSSAFGLKRTAPDEFAVVTQAPLVIPPDFQMRPPVPGAPRPQQLTPQGDAQRALFERTLGEGRKSTTEAQLLSKAQTDRANPDIKQLVAKETNAVVPKDEGFVDQLMFWKSDKPERSPEVVVDPGSESRRLTEAQLVGANATQGKTPAVKEDSPGFFGRVFGWIF